MRVLSGIQSSGRLHLGKYLGAVKQHIELQEKHECLYFIANYHALTTIRDADQLAGNTFDVALEYLALGLDPDRAALFRQTEVPQVTELAWILATVTGKGLLERAHSYKDKVAKGIAPSMGLFGYPLLMAADILIYRSQLVPVGRDQIQHIEMTQDIAAYFNNAFHCDALIRPEAQLNEAQIVPGIDGQKMSSSYGNMIELFDKPKTIRKRIMNIKTDSKTVDEPKDPDSCNLFAIFRLLASPEETAEMADRYRAGGLGYGTVKKRLADIFDEFIGPARQRREELNLNPDRVEAALATGATKARAIAEQVMAEVRAACGLTVRRRAKP